MRIVGIASGTKIYAPDDSYFSFFNSPYISHSHGSSIDIYPHHQSWSDYVVSPVGGKIVRIKKIKMGQPKEFPTEDFDYAIGIQPDSSETDIVRILHCDPSVVVGDTIEIGDSLGVTLRSRYFNYWTGPHYHVELMHTDSFERSSKSYPFDEVFRFARKKGAIQRTDIDFEVNEVTEDYVKGIPRGVEHASLSDLVGLAAMDENETILGMLDGGLSHYKQGGVVGGLDIGMNTQVFFANTPVGSITASNRFLRGPAITPFLDGHPLRGLSCFIYPNLYTKQGIPPLVLVPNRYDEFRGIIEVGDVCQLQIRSVNNMVKAD